MGSSAPSAPTWLRLFDLLFATAAVIVAVALYLAFAREGVTLPNLASVAALAALLPLWMMVRRPTTPMWVDIVLVLNVSLIPILSDTGGVTFPLFLVSFAFVTFRWGWKAIPFAVGGEIAMTAGYAICANVVDRLPTELLAVVLSDAFAIAVGVLLRAMESARADAARMAAQLKETNDKLRATMAMQRDLVLAQERSRAARDMHDGLGSRLTVVGMSLSFASRMRSVDPEAAWAEVASAHEMNAEALAEMRRWVRALNPPELIPDVGGAGAFDAIAESFRGTGMNVVVTHRGDAAPLYGDVSIFAVRMVQECLTNTLRHGTATTVTISLEQDATSVRIRVEDDGGEVDNHSEGFGLRSLRERVEAMGGQFFAGPVDRVGFRVEALCPLEGRGA